jgi:hypothetical protein
MIMSKPNYRQIYAIEKKNKERVLKVNPYLQDRSGIYFLTRIDEDGIGYFYIGQASVSVLGRVAQHLSGYQHIDLSLKKRGLYDEKENPHGWKVKALYYPKDELDKWEQYWILEYTKQGYQCRYNKTAGGQGAGKEKINEYKPSKGYRDGLKQGEKNLAKELSNIIDKHLVVTLKPEKANNKVSRKQFEKFKELLKVGDSESE